MTSSWTEQSIPEGDIRTRSHVDLEPWRRLDRYASRRAAEAACGKRLWLTCGKLFTTLQPNGIRCRS
jgi:hypothetical protein